MRIDLDALYKQVDKGNVVIKKGGSDWNRDLAICNYTNKCQFEGEWNDTTMICRGLVIDINTGEVVAKPFTKFFNISEHESDSERCDYAISLQDKQDSTVSVYEKMDGSLGVLYYYGGEWRINTRSTFHTSGNPISSKAYQMLGKYNLNTLDTELTYIVEIIYPGNRVVVDYKGKEGLYLIGAIHTKTGIEIETDSIDWPFKPIVYSFSNLSEVKDSEEIENKEGYVLVFPESSIANDCFRVKYKFPSYLKLHSVMTGFSKYKLWEVMKNGDVETYEYIVRITPKDVSDSIKQVEEDIMTEYEEVFTFWKELYENKRDKFTDRKGFAQWALTQKEPGLLFNLYDDNEEKYAENIWETIKPSKTHGFFINELNATE